MDRRKLPAANRQIFEEAATWFVSFRTENLTNSDRQEFHDWLKRSPEHIRAYLEIAWTYVDMPSPAREHTAAELIRRALASSNLNVVELSRTKGDRAGVARHPGRPVRAVGRPRLRPLHALMAGLAVVGCGLGLWAYGQRNTYSTAVGVQRSITLPDGSVIDLNARTKVRVAFHKHERDVELIYGEAYFSVAKDSSRPFIVLTNNASVRAVGTHFDVNLRSAETTVTVLEGRVTVRKQVAVQNDPLLVDTKRGADTVKSGANPSLPRVPEGPSMPLNGDAEVSLGVGQQTTVTATSVRTIAEANVVAATGWMHHQLIFDGTPLSEVIEEFGRYSTRRLVIDSPSLEKLQISGQYTSSSPDSLLRFLSLQQGIILRDIDGETHISQE